MYNNRILEILCLVILITLALVGVSWGPPSPPPEPTPLGNAEMYSLTAAGMAAYGFWKMRK